MAQKYIFTQPVRYYKANDPYFYEIDNLPIRQLEENILWLKDQLEGAPDDDEPQPGTPEYEEFQGRFLTGNSEISITNIKELKPKLLSGRTVRVNAGKYTARVNDAYDIAKPLSKFIFPYGGPGDTVPGVGSVPRVIPNISRVWTTAKKNEVWDEFINSMAGGGMAYNMNGLEVNYTFHTTPGGLGKSWGTQDFDPNGGVYGFPIYNFPGSFWNTSTWPGEASFATVTPGRSGDGSPLSDAIEFTFQSLGNIHQEFVKIWRGVFRTAVVDFPQSSVEIAAFNDDDYRYLVPGSNPPQSLSLKDNATHRIDLLVAYTMSIDSSSTTLNDYGSNYCAMGGSPVPTTITKPVLGVVRGAGYGLDKELVQGALQSINATNPCPGGGTISAGSENSVDVAGKKILANTNDAAAASNYGITNTLGVKIHGSFPSPDDLLNLAPVLALDGVDADFQKIGQSVLPLAYIVVRKGAASLASSDILDIRPFLRTTEFTYNERAGIAAANPPLSLANPAVGAYQLQDVINQVYTSMGTLVGEDSDPYEESLGRVLYTDYVMGGLGYGVEGTLLTMNENGADAADPWGANSTAAFYGGFTFGAYTGSKAFLEDTNEDRRHAFLTYLYNNRQDDLKRWLANPNVSVNSQPGNYLNLPTLRNIPLYPEWDPPFDLQNYVDAATNTGTTSAAPKPTWWMWMEGVNRARPFRYVPGGVASTDTADSDAALSKEYLPGYSIAGDQDEEYTAFTQMSAKKLEVVFPSWVNDYDILVEYINCQPMSYAGDDVNTDLYEPHLGLGNGLSVNKGPVVLAGSQKKATFEIMSAGQSIPANNMLRNSDGRINDSDLISPVRGAYYKFLTYSVMLPEFREDKWRTQSQAGGNTSNSLRYTPKMGAAYYPTVKFTIVGYPNNKITQNATLQDNGTLIPSNATGLEDNMLYSAYPPIYPTSIVDIQNLT